MDHVQSGVQVGALSDEVNHSFFTMAANKHQHQVQFKLRRTKTLLKACRMIKSEKKKKTNPKEQDTNKQPFMFPLEVFLSMTTWILSEEDSQQRNTYNNE